LTILLAAALLVPSLFWDKGPETAHLLQDAGIDKISVPAALEASWKNVAGISVTPVDPSLMRKVPPPSIRRQRRMASATMAPWVDSNGWRFLRDPGATYFYDAAGNTAALAAAEAFVFGVHAHVHTDEAGLRPLGQILAFLCKLKPPDAPSRVNIGFIDDGSPASGEFMNLLVRRNLLFRVVKQPDPALDLTVKPGSAEYPASEAANPALLAEKVRANLIDEKRLLRIYGTEVVVGRLCGTRENTRLYLLNYAAIRMPVDGLRVRVLGNFRHEKIFDFGTPNEQLLDVSQNSQATEFTLKDLSVLAMIDLTH
jgi:hypothetical protein